MKKNKKGFSLIELLVVIAIIGILSSVVMVSLNSARAKGRDAKRITDVKQISLALALYYDACGRVYPNPADGTSATSLDGAENNSGTPGVDCAANFNAFLNPVPQNPSGGGISGAYTYVTNAGFTDYVLQAQLEAPNANALNNDIDNANRPTGFTTPPCDDAAAPYYYCVGS